MALQKTAKVQRSGQRSVQKTITQNLKRRLAGALAAFTRSALSCDYAAVFFLPQQQFNSSTTPRLSKPERSPDLQRTFIQPIQSSVYGRLLSTSRMYTCSRSPECPAGFVRSLTWLRRSTPYADCCSACLIGQPCCTGKRLFSQ
jgi:hypothetical protein